MFEAANVRNAEFNNGLGCNISVTLSDGVFVDNEGAQFTKDDSPKKMGFLESLIRRSSSDNKGKQTSTQSSWPNIFARKTSIETKKPQGADEEMAKFIEQLELEGRSEAEINLHLSHINDVRTVPQPAAPSLKGKVNFVTQFFRDVQQAFKEEVLMISPYPEHENDIGDLTINISTAPFYGAPIHDMDMSYEELSSLEPVYVGSTCINNLPTCKHDGTPLPGDQTNCPVCLCELTEGEHLKSLPCVHFFHKDCIDRWLMVGHTCPVCKALVE